MVKVSATTDSICLEYIKDGNTMPYSAWKDDSEASIYADIVSEFVDNGQTIRWSTSPHASLRQNLSNTRWLG